MIELLDLIGTFVFAVSGAMVGIKHKLDLFGVYVLAIVTASGGGLIRDVFIGNEIPIFFREPKYLLVVTVGTLMTMMLYHEIKYYLPVLKIFDALGLGVFSVIGAFKAMDNGYPFIGIIFLAMLTGIGGGILRDVFVREVPLVFRSEIYALASFAGSFFYWILYTVGYGEAGIYLASLIILTIRLLAVKFNIHLKVISSH